MASPHPARTAPMILGSLIRHRMVDVTSSERPNKAAKASLKFTWEEPTERETKTIAISPKARVKNTTLRR